ncbi:NAD(P)-dependent oxidoreductase [Rhodococcus sp. B50]|uniref:NAD(P)-dependent oxidoreductase n=1 Tax=Rhodococcus sp. B50 TaxID=2682847 RepID=UPI001BD3E752|nr:NAD(P)-dependent oxidoreductase [Rhodococcus sp. B50]MBS9376289.1 Hydroxypyruvate reductase [Rhodococcus sp. B50]
MTPPRILSHLGDLPLLQDMLAEAEVDAQIVAVPQHGPIDDNARGEVLLTLMQGTPNLPEVLDRGVRWIHTVGTGVDEFPVDLLGDRTLTISRGATSVPIAEWVMAQILTAEKRLPESWVHEPPERWGGPELGGIHGSTIAILGFGATGTALATRALAFGAQVKALRRSDTPSPVPGVTLVRTLEALLADADHVVLAAPLTEATEGIVDARFLSLMKPDAHLVNVARAGLIVEKDLREALDGGRIALASIDVAPIEPLPAGHWLYRHPRVRFSPHASWNGRGVWEAIMRSFADNLVRWTAAQPLDNVVDLVHGY